MKLRILIAVSLLALLTLVLLGCTLGGNSLSRVTPTPTKTARPLVTATLTPAPSATPTATVAVPTAVPPTDTAAAPTDAPTEALPTATAILPTEVPPTDTPAPTEVPATATPAPPTDTPQPRPTNTPAPPTSTPVPEVDYRVVEQRLMSKQENEAQRYMILIRVINAAGNSLPGLVVWDPAHPEQQPVTGSKPESYHAEYLFWNYDGYQLEVQGANSEKTKVLSTDVHKIPIEDLVTAGYCSSIANCDPGQLVQHYSWYVTFQRTW